MREITPTEPRRRNRILVVDDDDSVRAGLHDVLVNEGYEVVTAANGTLGVAAIRRQPCDFVLLDMNMPSLNGWGTIGELRSITNRLPMIIITARSDQGTIAKAAGVELMEKPLDLPVLLRRIRELLMESQALPGAEQGK